ncbi:MAG: four helix bundle protein [Bacteroidota bacterium]
MKFEELRVWQKALDLTEKIHLLTKDFPKEELFILTSQIKRATDSIALNIAEGSTGQTNKEFYKFLGYSVRSAIEVVGCLHIGKRRNYISEAKFQELYNELETLIKMIHSLRKTLII